MTLQQFINKYNGKTIDFDGAFGGQCVDLYRFYVKEVWNLPKTPSVVGAYQILNTIGKGYLKFTSGVPIPGDVVVWSQSLVKNGHVAVVVEADTKKLKVFEQNSPTGSPCRIGEHSYKYVIGWFRPERSKVKTYYIERPSPQDPNVMEIGIARELGEETVITWASDPAWGHYMTQHFKPEGVFKLIPKK